jgi:hypothetical protein
MTGHLGAALVAGVLYSEAHPDLDDAVHAGIEGELKRILAGDERWAEPGAGDITVAQLFEPFPGGALQPDPVPLLAQSLALSIDALRQSGHNVIFATLAMRGLTVCPELGTQAVVSGIDCLVQGFADVGGGRVYFGQECGWMQAGAVALPEDAAVPAYRDRQDMVRIVIGELIDSASAHRQGVGGLWHIVNHAAALVDLEDLGYADLARRGFAAHRHHVRLWRALPDLSDELGPKTLNANDPRTAEYWTTGALKRDSALLTHRVKTMYGLSRLTPLVDDPGLVEDAWQAMRFLM